MEEQKSQLTLEKAKSLTMPQIIAQVQQKNGSQSFRPPLEALPESYFRGLCYEILCEFFEESQINFQIYQSSCLDEIEL